MLPGAVNLRLDKALASSIWTEVDEDGLGVIERAMRALIVLEVPFVVRVDQWGQADVEVLK